MNNIDIDVFIYSYKGKNLLDVVKNINKTSSSKIRITVLDQHPLDRSDIFKIDNVIYKHIIWDMQSKPNKYKGNFIKRTNSTYVLVISDDVILENGWDKKFINFIKDNVIISGSGSVRLYSKNLFYLDKEIFPTNDFTITNYINRDFIFAKSSTLKLLDYPFYIKFNGEEEAISLIAYSSGIEVYSAPSELYKKYNNTKIIDMYVPFSLNHNYNEVVSLLLTGKNKFQTLKNIDSISNFENFHGIKFKEAINPLPFIDNDVEYDQYASHFGRMGGKKFVEKVTKVR